jgi:hypothetical protein
MALIQDELLHEAIAINKLRQQHSEANREVLGHQADRRTAEDRERATAQR